MFLHCGIEFLRKVIGYIRHPRFLFISSAHTAFILICFLIVLLLRILTVPWRALLERMKMSGCLNTMFRVYKTTGIT